MGDMISIMKGGFSGGASTAKRKKKKARPLMLSLDGEVV
jgi:hypothetical protein